MYKKIPPTNFYFHVILPIHNDVVEWFMILCRVLYNIQFVYCGLESVVNTLKHIRKWRKDCTWLHVRINTWIVIMFFYCFRRFFISNLTLSVLRQYVVYEALPSTAVNETSLSQVDGELWHRSLAILFFSHWFKVEDIQKHQIFRGRCGQEDIVSDGWLRDPGFKSRAPTCWKTQRPIYPSICV